MFLGTSDAFRECGQKYGTVLTVYKSAMFICSRFCQNEFCCATFLVDSEKVTTWQVKTVKSSMARQRCQQC